MKRTDIRLGLPSKGYLGEGAVKFLADCGLKVNRPNPRQYIATIPGLPTLTVMLQRPGDIVIGIRQGTLDFGISGWDVISEECGSVDGCPSILPLHDSLGFAPCTLNLAVPTEWVDVATVADLVAKSAEIQQTQNRPLRIATKFVNLTRNFLDQIGTIPYELIKAEGTLEIAPTIGYADMIADLVSSGITLRDNQLKLIEGGEILKSQAALIANRDNLQSRPEVLEVARQLLEYIEARTRAKDSFMVVANLRGDSAETTAAQVQSQPNLRGLQGPTIAPIISGEGQNKWFSVSLVVRKSNLTESINELRQIGGSGVIVTPITYIFEEEPERYQAMLSAIS